MKKALSGALVAALLACPAIAQIQDLDEPLPADGSNPAVEAMSKGNFPAERRGAKTPSGVIQKSWANASADAGIRVGQRYDPSTRVDLLLRERVSTTVAIPEWDSVDEFILSDSVHFGIKRGKKPWMLHVWPKAAGADGNLTIIGESGLWYLFRLVGHNEASTQPPDIFYGLSAPAPRIDAGTGEKTPAAARVASKTADWLFDIPYDPTKNRFDLEWSGDQSIAPERVYRDEHRTFLDYGDRADSAQGVGIWKVQDGIDQQVNWLPAPDRRVIVVHWTGPITLRNGQRTVCIRPQS